MNNAQEHYEFKCLLWVWNIKHMKNLPSTIATATSILYELDEHNSFD